MIVFASFLLIILSPASAQIVNLLWQFYKYKCINNAVNSILRKEGMIIMPFGHNKFADTVVVFHKLEESAHMAKVDKYLR